MNPHSGALGRGCRNCRRQPRFLFSRGSHCDAVVLRNSLFGVWRAYAGFEDAKPSFLHSSAAAMHEVRNAGHKHRAVCGFSPTGDGFENDLGRRRSSVLGFVRPLSRGFRTVTGLDHDQQRSGFLIGHLVDQLLQCGLGLNMQRFCSAGFRIAVFPGVFGVVRVLSGPLVFNVIHEKGLRRADLRKVA